MQGLASGVIPKRVLMLISPPIIYLAAIASGSKQSRAKKAEGVHIFIYFKQHLRTRRRVCDEINIIRATRFTHQAGHALTKEKDGSIHMVKGRFDYLCPKTWDHTLLYRSKLRCVLTRRCVRSC